MRFNNDIDDKQDCILSIPFTHDLSCTPLPYLKKHTFTELNKLFFFLFFLITQNTINVTISKNAVYFVYYYVISSIVLDSFRLYM